MILLFYQLVLILFKTEKVVKKVSFLSEFKGWGYYGAAMLISYVSEEKMKKDVNKG